ncbi:hypothetical protein HGRIS_001125 [Hohenbuehelia grisea]|uniref:Uncharacterized protein n=1 Tax=Hohenbuehelia grisea TaxID=104357 RepID=A0ABR3JNK0_9AGAR
MARPKAVAVAFEGPLNTKRTRAELDAIAEALGGDVPGQKNMKEQIKSIKAHLDAHPELAGDPRFQLLFPRDGAAPLMKKRSTDKASEAAAAAELDADKPPTGANKALLQAKVTVDPPPQFAPVRPSNNAARQPSPLTLGNALRDAVNAHQDSSSPEPPSSAANRQGRVDRETLLSSRTR